MGILDDMKEKLGVGSSQSAEAAKSSSSQSIREIRSVLAGNVVVPKEVQDIILPHEKLADMRKIAQEIKGVGPEFFGINKTTYTKAVMPPAYDNPRLHTAEYGTNPDVWSDGDRLHSKRREEILSSKVEVQIGGDYDHPEYQPYYSCDRYFVEVNGKALPKASVYHFANGQTQVHSCDYDSKGRAIYFRNFVGDKVLGEVKRTYDEKGGYVSDFVENKYDENGQLKEIMSFYVQEKTDTSGKKEWVEYRVVKKRGADGKWAEEPAKEFSRRDNPKDLYINGWELRLRRLAMPHPKDTAKEPYIGKPGYGV